jgi:hypothetical protein
MDARSTIIGRLLKFDSIDEMESMLRYYRVPVDTWAPTGLTELYTEYQLGECKLYLTPENRFVRQIVVAKITICHKNRILVEAHQFYPKSNKRHLRPHCWVSEKLMTDDFEENNNYSILRCCRRAVREELNLQIDKLKRFKFRSTTQEITESHRYHGLLRDSTIHSFKLHLFCKEFNALGYEEDLVDNNGELFRRTKFDWMVNDQQVLDAFLLSRTFVNRANHSTQKSYMSSPSKAIKTYTPYRKVIRGNKLIKIYS